MTDESGAPSQPMSMVVKNLETTSDKIRALANEGYLRKDIATFLDIRYQHVRKVLEDEGIKGGLSRGVQVDRPPIVIEEEALRPEPVFSSVLLNGGFRRLGEWRAVGDLEFELSVKAPTEPGVYAFVVDDVIKYVGLTLTGLRTRMGHYRRGHLRHKTSARVKALIAKELCESRKVEILIATPEPLQWNSLPVNSSAGLEAGLIRLIRPEWNMLGAKKAR